jgi:thiol-disulfide isomerase/thioredoxin
VKIGLGLILILAVSASAQTLSGVWDGTVKYDDYKIPFPIEFSQRGSDISASFFNGEDRVTSTDGRVDGNLVTINFDQYATRLNATLSDGILRGTYGGVRYGFHEFEAQAHRDAPASTSKAPDIAGVWDLPNESPKGEHAWRLIIRQDGPAVSAAILRVDGDTGALTGKFGEGKFVLNHFDGARAAILEITPKPDGTLDVDLKGFHSPAKHFVAVRIAEARAKGLPEPTDPDNHTRIKNPNEPFTFSFPDLNGKLVSNTDPQFRDKVVIVNITGSWCPNCHDEAPFLADLYRRYHTRGLEIVALDFEETEQRKDPARLKAFIKKYDIQYTYLIAGEPAELQAKIPQAETLNSWPTTFFLGRDGRVRAIHAGFAAPASGEFNLALKKEVTDRVEQLLSEDIRASR